MNSSSSDITTATTTTTSHELMKGNQQQQQRNSYGTPQQFQKQQQQQHHQTPPPATLGDLYQAGLNVSSNKMTATVVGAGAVINNINPNTTSANSATIIGDYDNRQSINNGPHSLSGLVGAGSTGGAECAPAAAAAAANGGTVRANKTQERYVWEMRARSPNVTPASTVLNSPDLNTDMQYSIHPHQRQLQQIRVGRSPGSQFEQHNILPQGLASPGSPTDVGKADGQCLRDGEIVVFDDIDTNWMNNKSNNSYSSNHSNSLRDSYHHANEDILKVTKMIGQLPIAEYEGSPRRFGNQQQQQQQQQQQMQMKSSTTGSSSNATSNTTTSTTTATNMLPKRPPGFPQRVSPMAATPVVVGNGSALTPQQQQQQHQEAAHARHQQMQQQHQFYAQATSSGGSSSVYFQQHGDQQQQQQYNNNDSNKSIGNLIDIDADDNDSLGIGAGGNISTAAVNNNGSSQHSSISSTSNKHLQYDSTAKCPTAGGATAGNKVRTPTFDYLYEFSETRKVLEEFFKANPEDEKRFTDFAESGDDMGSCDTHHDYLQRQRIHDEDDKHIEQSYIGQRLARIPKEELYMIHRSPTKKQKQMTVQPQQQQQLQQLQQCDNNITYDNNDIELYIDSNSRSSGDLGDTELEANMRRHSRNFTLSPETTDYDSNCGDLDSLSNDINCTTDYGKLYTSMPVLEDGLSSGHASDTENNCQNKYDTNGSSIDSGGGGGDGGGVGIGELGNGSECVVAAEDSNGLEGVHFDKQQQHHEQLLQQEMLEQNYYNKNLIQDCSNSSSNNILMLADCGGSNNIAGNNGMDNNLIANLLDIDVGGDPQLQHLQQQIHQHNQLYHQYSHQNQMDSADIGYLHASDTTGCCNNISINSLNTSNEQCNNDSLNYEPIYATVNKQTKRQSQQQLQLQTQGTQQQQQQRLKQPGRAESVEIQEAMKEIRSALQRAKTQPEKLKFCDEVLPPGPDSPIWVPRKNQMDLENSSISACMAAVAPTVAAEITLNKCLPCEDDEQDTDLETDRLLGQQRIDEQDFYEDKTIWPKTSRISNSGLNSHVHSPTNSADIHQIHLKPQSFSSATIRQGIGTSLTPNTPEHCQILGQTDSLLLGSPEKLQYSKSPSGSIKSLKDSVNSDKKAKSRNKEGLLDPAVLIEGVLFRARYLGSTQLVCEGQPTKSTRMMQAEEAVSRIKAPEGESQPSTEVDLFISTEKIMVLNTDLKEIMMDHALRTISYIADIGDLVVLMARRRFVHSDPCNAATAAAANTSPTANNSAATAAADADDDDACNNKEKELKENGLSCNANKHNRTPKMICHVFESDEAQFIAQSIGQAFQVAYMEFLKANGIENENLAKEMDYQEVLNSQEIFGDELEIFAKKELQKEVVVPKAKGEILGVVIVESGWGSMLPTVVIANLMSGGAAARCGQLNIGDQLIAVNGLSLVGLPLSTCQNYIRNAKNQTAVKFTVVPCPPVVEVKILRPKALFQLGFSVQNGVICSLLRGGIAERGGVRVGHRIIEINNQSVVAVPHDTIVKLLSSSVGEILMKTMPTSMFRLLTGQETPIYI